MSRSRISPRDLHSLDEASRELIEEGRQRMGFVPNDALTMARVPGLQPNAVEDSHFEELNRHYTDDEAAEIVAVIALFGFLNRWNDTVQTDLEGLPAAAS